MCEAIDSKSVFIPKMILLFFQVLDYLRICSSRRYRNKKKTFCHVFWNVSNILWNSRPIRATTSKYICSVACGMFQAIDVHGDYNFFRIQSGLRWPNLLRCGCFGLRNSICDLMATGRVTHSLCNQFYWTSKLVESPRIMWWTCLHMVSVSYFVSLLCFCSPGKQ